MQKMLSKRVNAAALFLHLFGSSSAWHRGAFYLCTDGDSPIQFCSFLLRSVTSLDQRGTPFAWGCLLFGHTSSKTGPSFFPPREKIETGWRYPCVLCHLAIDWTLLFFYLNGFYCMRETLTLFCSASSLGVQLRVPTKLYSAGPVGYWLRDGWGKHPADHSTEQVPVPGTSRRLQGRIVSAPSSFDSSPSRPIHMMHCWQTLLSTDAVLYP